MECDCISYNQPSLGGTKRSVVMKNPFTSFDVSIDPCIACIVQELWDAGVKTWGSCCGHNGKIGEATVGIIDAKQFLLARKIVKSRVKILFSDEIK